jgi:hypothetical protein
MKKLTILKTVAFLVGWIVSFQLIPTGLHLMSSPSSVKFVLGLLFAISTIGSTFYFAFKFREYLAKLLKESRESRLEKIREQFKKDVKR